MNKSASSEMQVARLPNAVGSQPLSLAHQPPAIGFLSVRVEFMHEAIEGLKIAFHKTGDDGKKGDQVSEDGLKTDAHGRAFLEEPVEVGTYWCVIEHQPDAEITTVDEIRHPVIVTLPVGRPRFDVG